MGNLYIRCGHSSEKAAFSLSVFESESEIEIANLVYEKLIPYHKRNILFSLKDSIDRTLHNEMTILQKLKWAIFGVSK